MRDLKIIEYFIDVKFDIVPKVYKPNKLISVAALNPDQKKLL